MSTKSDPALREDLLAGAEAIAAFTGIGLRRVYYLATQNTPQLPVFRIGTALCARKSELLHALSAEHGGEAA